MLFERREHKNEPMRTVNLSLFSNYYHEQLIYKSEIIEKLLTYSKDTKYLEVSAALGKVSFDMLGKDKEIYITIQEQSDICINEMKRYLKKKRLGSRCAIVSSDSTKMPFSDESFDVVFSINALHNWDDPCLVIEEMKRILVPGGRIIINDLRRDLLEPFAEYRIRELQAIENGEWMIRNFINSWKASYSMSEISSLLNSIYGIECKVNEDGPMAMSIEIIK